jgi:hypothetical protein
LHNPGALNYTRQQRFTTHLLSLAPHDILRYIQK